MNRSPLPIASEEHNGITSVNTKVKTKDCCKNTIYCKFVNVCQGFIWQNLRTSLHRKIITRKHNSCT